MIALRVALAARDWTYATLADHLGIHRETVAGYGRGAHRPTPERLAQIRAVLGDDLVKAEEHYGACESRVQGRPKG
jgi:transcriptional regulator with XRE-family HTH domain